MSRYSVDASLSISFAPFAYVEGIPSDIRPSVVCYFACSTYGTVNYLVLFRRMTRKIRHNLALTTRKVATHPPGYVRAHTYIYIDHGIVPEATMFRCVCQPPLSWGEKR